MAELTRAAPKAQRQRASAPAERDPVRSEATHQTIGN
jgi:hypothetical protein